MSEERRRLAFLVGAGLVVDAGLPTAVGLTRRFRDYLEAQAARDDEEAAVHRRCASLYRFLIGGIRFQAGVLDSDPDAEVNIETLATAALRLRGRLESPIAPYAYGWHPRLLELEGKSGQALVDFLNMMYARLTDWLTPADADHVRYLAHLKSFCEQPWGVDIFSLNYDLCIESALTRVARMEFENGFTSRGWDPGRLLQTGGVRLCKLHGSLDWIDDEVWGICALEYPRHDDADELRGAGRPLLIFGTDAKLTAKDPYLTLLYLFSARLKETDVLVVIGYGFADEYINDMIQQRFANNPRLRVILVSPKSEEIKESVSFLRGSPKVIALQLGAKEALEGLALLEEVRRVLDQTSDEAPFSE